MDSSNIKIPRDFLIGSATAAFQIEGAVRKDGRGDSIWDTFSHRPGKIDNDHNADITCDHYHSYQKMSTLCVACRLMRIDFQCHGLVYFLKVKGK